MDPVDEHTDEEPTPICHKCCAPISSNADFCSECGVPVGATTGLDPIRTIWAESYVYREATKIKRSKIVLWGAWLFLAPIVLSFFLLLPHTQLDAGWLVALAINFFAALIYGSLLYKITKNYLTGKPVQAPEDELE